MFVYSTSTSGYKNISFVFAMNFLSKFINIRRNRMTSGSSQSTVTFWRLNIKLLLANILPNYVARGFTNIFGKSFWKFELSQNI
jgi:hypothetical protein